jgi:NAD(P)-dependent dehydrogenase (short-subunit alcohol dehydrogenase family)
MIEAHSFNPLLLAERTVVIPGGTGNVGRVLVRAFLASGATVVVPARSGARAAELRAALGDTDVARLDVIPGELGTESDANALHQRVADRYGTVHAVVASLGRFVAAPSVTQAPLSDLRSVIDHYLIAHFLAARALVPLVEPGGSYTLINGPLAFDSLFPGSGLVSVATAAQAMLARLLMMENLPHSVRVNEVVLYTPFGWANADPNHAPLEQSDVALYLAYLASPKGNGIAGKTIHLDSRRPLEILEAA